MQIIGQKGFITGSLLSNMWRFSYRFYMETIISVGEDFTVDHCGRIISRTTKLYTRERFSQWIYDVLL